MTETTHEEKQKMYNKLSKKELIEMLIEANKIISSLTVYEPYNMDTLTLYSEICGCNPKNGGNGICGCTIPNQQLLNNNLL